MSKFDDMASQAEAAANQACADREQAAADKKSLAQALLDEGKAVLNKQVLPTLHEAKEAFEKAGVGVAIEENTGYKNAGTQRTAIITFRCYTIGSSLVIGGVPYPAGGTAKFEHDGHHFSASFTENRGRAEHIRGNGEEAATTGAKLAIDTYHAARNEELGRRR